MDKPNFLRVPYAQSVHGQEEIDAVVNVLKTSTQMGKNVTEMENNVAKMFDKKFGLMTNSGTSSLMLAAEVSGLPKGSEVITAAFTFATTVTLSNGVPIESVSKMLGHKSLRTTQHYAKILDRKVSEDMKILKAKMQASTQAVRQIK